MATTYDWRELGDQIMDSRSLIAIAEELRDALAAFDEGDESALDSLDSSTGPLEDDEEEARALLAAIDELADAGIADWQYGEIFIREDYFLEYAQQLAEDIGAIDPNASWPLSHIDWDAAADALKQDYTEIDFRGMTYYVRA